MYHLSSGDGCQNEATAYKRYVAQHSQQHTNLQVQLCGLHISTDHPYLAATPDGTVSCDCCGEGLLEIKCPFKYKDDILADVTDSAFYLERQPTGKMVPYKMTLNRENSYII